MIPMAQVVTLILAIIGIMVLLAIINSILGIISKINLRNILIVLVIAGGVLYLLGDGGPLGDFEGFSSNRISGAVTGGLERVLPEYINSNETCSEIEDDQDLPEKYKRDLCEEVCSDDRNIGNRCIDDILFCQCW
jgi:hypothetical protein